MKTVWETVLIKTADIYGEQNSKEDDARIKKM